MKRIINRVSFDWDETYDGIGKMVEVLKMLGFIVYDIAPEGVTYIDYIIANAPVKKYQGKEV